MVEDAGAAAIAVHGRTAAQSYSGFSDWDFISGVAASVSIPVFGSGDVIEAEQASTAATHRRERRAGRPRRAAQSLDPRRRPTTSPRAARRASSRCRSAGSSCSTTSTCCFTRAKARPRASVTSRRSTTRATRRATIRAARGRDRWVINKLRALGAWYTQGFDNGSRLSTAINQCDSIGRLREIGDALLLRRDTSFAARTARSADARTGPPAP